MIRLEFQTILGPATVTLDTDGRLLVLAEDPLMEKMLRQEIPRMFGARGHFCGEDPEEYELGYIADSGQWRRVAGLQECTVHDRPPRKRIPGPPPGAYD